MNEVQLTINLYLILDVLLVVENVNSSSYKNIQALPFKKELLNFSIQLKKMMHDHPLIISNPGQSTTRLAIFRDSIGYLKKNHLLPMIGFLETHQDIFRFLYDNWSTLEKMYYKASIEDVILLEEYTLMISKDYIVERSYLTESYSIRSYDKHHHVLARYAIQANGDMVSNANFIELKNKLQAYDRFIAQNLLAFMHNNIHQDTDSNYLRAGASSLTTSS